MKIAFFTDTYHPDLNGVTVSIDHFSEELQKKGHEVVFFAPKAKGYKEHDKNVFRISSFKLIGSEPQVRFPLPISADTLREIAQQDFDIVHAHGNGPFSLLGYQVARMKGVPYVMTFHTLHPKYTHYFLKGKVITPRMVATGMRVYANICDGIIVPSKKMMLELQSYGVKKEMHIIPTFVPATKYLKARTNYLHNLLSLPPSTPLVLTVGRLGIEKSFDFVIQSFKEVTLQNSTAHLVIIGKGPEKDSLVTLVHNLEIQDRVHFIDNVAQHLMPQAYKDADIFVFPSVTETQGLCVLEAAFSSLPLVLSKDLAYDNTIEDGRNGFILPLKTNAFAQAMITLLTDEKMRKKMGAESLKIATSNFNADKITNELIGLYNSALAQHQASRTIIKRVNKEALARIVQLKRNLDRILN